ncbi:ribosomal protein L22 [Dacryopinax primogenitus]|uniref:Ribosomal protein L22 n=1 Tax=Dacryopinax primogenitus (strain DJM 731) TaxID=1858805 RepID=M5GD30_DACPD|nr:ribosomal protein L22 [Dacryopinax primogenitus]EJU06580.1 ribosomal protein L22 [Dacryopinax primogenitus]
MEEIERKRARERAAEQGEGSIFDTEAQEQLKREHEEEAEILELEEVPSQQWVGQAKRVDNRPKQGKMITVGQETHVAKRQKIREQTGKTAMFKISHRKLNKLAHQIGGKPIDQAILQMQFSEKRASTRIKSMLVLARDQGGRRGMLRERLVVAEAWVNKGPKLRRLDIKGRGRLGIKHHPSARMHIVLKEGKTWQEKKDDKFKKLVKAVRSAGLYREDVPIRNHGPRYTW